MMTNKPQTVTFTVSSSTYTLHGMAHPIVSLTAEPYQAQLLSADFGGDAELIFDVYGMPDSSGSVVIGVGNHVRTITVDTETGKASAQ